MADEQIDYEALSRLFKALGNTTRLQILMKTIAGEFCVSDLERDLDRSQPNISQHLAVLRERGLVTPERDGQRVCYYPANKKVKEIIQTANRALESEE